MKTRALACNAGNRAAAGRCRGAVQRVGRPLALLAVVFQLALVFAHHHFDLSRGLGEVAVASDLVQAGATTAPRDEGRPGQAPVTAAHAPCVLCTTIHAAATLGAGAPPLALPATFAGSAVPSLAVAPIVPPQRVAAFDCRGPPPA